MMIVVGSGQRDIGAHRRWEQTTNAGRTDRVSQINPRSGL